MLHDKDGEMTRPFVVIEADSRGQMIEALVDMIKELLGGDSNARGSFKAADFDYDMGDDSVPDYWTRKD